MIKIGVVSYDRKDMLDVVIEKINENTKNEFELLVACDSSNIFEHCEEKGYPKIGGKRMGIARNKNRIIKWFIENPTDHLFIIEDDAYPKKYGWDEWYINAHRETGYPIFLFIPDDKSIYDAPYIKKWGSLYGKEKEVQVFKNYTVKMFQFDGATLLSLTPLAINTLGGMNKEFQLYGGEHSEYLQRAVRAKLIPRRAITLAGCGDWFNSEDVVRYYHNPSLNTVLNQVGVKEELAKQGLEIFDRVHKTSLIYQDPIIE